jgi:tetratricopeptide (TPR) repeat protein
LAKLLKEDYDSAIADFDECIKLDDKHSNAYYSRGLAKYKREDNDGAIADLYECIKLDDKHSNAYYSRGLAKYKKEDYDGAIVDFDECLIRLNKLVTETEHEDNHNPRARFSIADAYHFRGRANFQKGSFEDAIEDYTNAIRRKTSVAYFQDRAKAARALARADENRALRLNNGPIVHQVAR